MNTEKEIVNYWLHKNGFFTINSIKAGHNKEIDVLAAKIKNGSLEKFQQIELSTSLSKSSNITLDNLSVSESVDKFIKATIQAGGPGFVLPKKNTMLSAVRSKFAFFAQLDQITLPSTTASTPQTSIAHQVSYQP